MRPLVWASVLDVGRPFATYKLQNLRAVAAIEMHTRACRQPQDISQAGAMRADDCIGMSEELGLICKRHWPGVQSTVITHQASTDSKLQHGIFRHRYNFLYMPARHRPSVAHCARAVSAVDDHCAVTDAVDDTCRHKP